VAASPELPRPIIWSWQRLAGHDRESPAAYRKAFAALATERPYSGLLFLALDRRLDLPRVRQLFRTPEQARLALADLGLR